MINFTTTLKRYCQKVSECSHNSSLEDWISIITENNCEILVLLNDFGKPKGLLTSNRLLSLFARESQSTSLNSPYLESGDYNPKSKEDLLLFPSCVSQDLAVGEFLATFQTKERETHYLLIDSQGRFVGLLDQHRLLQELTAKPMSGSVLNSCSVSASGDSSFRDSLQKQYQSGLDQASPYKPTIPAFLKTSSQVKEVSTSVFCESDGQSPSSLTSELDLDSLFQLLEKITFPLKIETTTGKTCFQNTVWQKVIGEDSQFENNEEYSKPYLNTLGTNIEFQNNFASAKKVDLSEFSEFSLKLPINWQEQSTKLDLVKKQLNLVGDLVDNVGIYPPSSKTVSGDKDPVNLSSRQEPAVDSQVSNSSNKREKITFYRLPLHLENESLALANKPRFNLVFPLPKFQQSTTTIQQNLKFLQEELTLRISHDVKSPLTAIIGLASLLKEEKVGNLNNRQIRYSKLIYYSGKKLVNLIDDFLGVTLLTSRKLQLKLETVSLEPFCRQMYDDVVQRLTTLERLRAESSVVFPELQLDISSQTESVTADHTYLTQILNRLMEVSLSLTDSQELFGITAEKWSDFLAITVWNEGGGLSSTQQEFMYKGIVASSNKLDSQSKNQLLGLNLAKQLARVHGGDISYISQHNYGSEFTLLLPDNQPQQSNVDLENRPLILLGETKTKRIVDLYEKLKSLGYHVVITRDMEDLQQKAECFQPTKILLNFSLIASARNSSLENLGEDNKVCNIPLILLKEPATTIDSNYLDCPLLSYPITRGRLAELFKPIEPQKSNLAQCLTVLRLSLAKETNTLQTDIASEHIFANLASSLTHHVIEADSLEQAEILAQIWNVDVVIWDSINLVDPLPYLESLSHFSAISSIPLITLDAKTTSAANTISQLTVFPCLIPENERSSKQLTQVIKIAAGLG